MDTGRSYVPLAGFRPPMARTTLDFHRLPRFPWVITVVCFLSLRVTRARAFQLDECPVGCSSHGQCREGLCACAAGWTGQDCSYFLADSADGRASEEGVLDEEEECVDDCSSHGTCSGGMCQCQAGYSGLSCNIKEECSQSCRPPNGNCNAGTCVCLAGFFGPDCADALCPNNCFGHGVCNKGACVCTEGWFGRLCDTHLDEASMCDPPCSANGQCVNGQCFCSSGFTGVDCSLQVQPSMMQQSALRATRMQVQTGMMQQSTLRSPGKSQVNPQTDRLELPAPAGSEPAQEYAMRSPSSMPAGYHGELPAAALLQHVEHANAPFVPPAPHVQQPQSSQIQMGAPIARPVQQLEAEVEDARRSAMYVQDHFSAKPAVVAAPQQTSQTRLHPSMLQMDDLAVPSSGVPPSAVSSGLDAVFKATQAAGSAADRLRQTAQQEYAEAAKRRISSAMEHAHQHAKQIPGFQEPVQPAVVVPPPAAPPVRQVEVFRPVPKHEWVPLAPPRTPSRAANVDHEDSIELSLESDDAAQPNLLHEFRNQIFAPPAGIAAPQSLMISSARQTPITRGRGCEADCSSHGTCLTNVGGGVACQCDVGYVGMICDMPRCDYDCNGRGTCVQGKCLCGKGWLGHACGDLRCPEDCHGVGYCLEGKCHCKTGYDGINCAKIKPAALSVTVKMTPLALLKGPPPLSPYHEGLTLRAIPAKKCPDNCNGKGICSTAGECQCQVGYSGQACEMFCPNECSHNGDCIEGSCLCFAGFLGVDCSITGCCSGHGTCDEPGTCVCEAGWDGDDCALKMMCADPSCSGHGTCAHGKCTCELGFSGDVCAIQDGGCNPPCGPNGACNPLSKKCECAGGAAGPTCLAAVSECPGNCNNRGLCMNGECMCGPGWMGQDCSKRFFKPGAPPTSPSKAEGGAGAAAKGQGILASIVGLGGGPGGGGAAAGGGGGGGSGEEGALTLNPDSRKLILGQASGGMVCGEGGGCSGHGICNAEYAKCECDATFYGEVCEMQHCPGFVESGQDCFGHGMCDMGNCQCAPGWGTPVNVMGQQKPESCKFEICPVGCGEHGKCFNGVCVCQQGWRGPNCKDPQCPDDCAGHGQCAFQSPHSPGQCVCDYGWGGAGCQRIAVYAELRKCPSDCSGNGLCMNGVCACNVGFRGVDCSDVVCAGTMTGPKCDQLRCPMDCNGRGLCMNGVCACWSAYAGSTCKMPIHCQEGCGKVCETLGLESRCNSCIGMCESAAPKLPPVVAPSLGVHNPFEDLQSTFLQENHTAVQRSGHAHRFVQSSSHSKHASVIAIASNSSGHQAHRSSRSHQKVRHREQTSVKVKMKHKHRRSHHREKSVVKVNASRGHWSGHHMEKKHRHHEASVSMIQLPYQHAHPNSAPHHHVEVSATEIGLGIHGKHF